MKPKKNPATQPPPFRVVPILPDGLNVHYFDTEAAAGRHAEEIILDHGLSEALVIESRADGTFAVKQVVFRG